MSEWMYECENERNVRGQVFKEIIDEFVINVQKYVISNQSWIIVFIDDNSAVLVPSEIIRELDDYGYNTYGFLLFCRN